MLNGMNDTFLQNCNDVNDLHTRANFGNTNRSYGTNTENTKKVYPLNVPTERITKGERVLPVKRFFETNTTA